MKHLRVCPSGLSIAGALLAIGMLYAAASPGQAKSTRKPWADSARRNAQLSSELVWTFGGKQQRGWYLYKPLI